MRGPIDVDCERFAWREQGEGPLVLLLHGLGGSRISWEPQLAALGADRRVVAWDMPGYGAAAALDRRPLSFGDLAWAAGDVITALGESSAHVVGISMGGMIAQHLALVRPTMVRSLTLLSTSPAFGMDGTRAEDWQAARLAPLDEGQQPADFADRVLRAIAGPHISAAALAEQKAAMARITSDALRASIECLVTHDTRDDLPRIAVPTAVLVGALDEETPPAYSRYLADRIPHSWLHVLPDAGHLLNVEAPDAVNAIISHHLAAAEAA